MSERMTNILGYLTLAAILAAIWVLFGEDPSRDQGARGERTFAGLAERINETAKVELSKAGDTLTLFRTDDGWQVDARSGYPANEEKVRAFLRGFALSERREPKTSNPDRFASLDLGDSATRVILSDDTGGALLDVQVGKRKEGGSGRSLTYVFQGTDTRAWLVGGIEAAPLEAVEWLDTNLLDIADSRIQTVTLNDVTLVRPLGATDFSVEGLAEDETEAAGYKRAEPARTLSRISLTDVAQTANPLMDPVTMGQFTTYDGLQVTFTLFARGEDHWLQLSANYDLDRAAGGDAGPLPDAPADGVAESEAINAKVRGWLFKISGFSADILTQKRSDFVESDEGTASPS